MLIGFDGTWNDENPKPGVRPSNVRRFGQCYAGEYIYEPGIGNDDDCSFLMQMLGGATGWGGKGIVRDACMKAGALIERGAKALLDVVGFSRGGALALHFANTVLRMGVPLPSTKKKNVKWVTNPHGKGRKPKITYTYETEPAKVRWLGLWDVVPAMGIPGNDVNLGYQLHAPEGARVHHAMALDVSDRNFLLKRVPGAEEVWFMGAHSEVGGGSGNERLSDCTLRWMIGKARKVGLKVDIAVLNLPGPRPLGLPQNKKEHDHSRRQVQPGDKVHRTVKREHYPSIPWSKVVHAG